MSYQVAILADVRGANLQDYFPMDGNEHYSVYHRPGSGIDFVTSSFLGELRKSPPDLIIITNGVCDLTIRNKSTKVTSLCHASVQEATEHYMIQIDKATGILTSMLKSSKVVFAPLTGIDLADYNGYKRRGLTGEELRQYQKSKQRHPLQD